jgi:hypothetical protein
MTETGRRGAVRSRVWPLRHGEKRRCGATTGSEVKMRRHNRIRSEDAAPGPQRPAKTASAAPAVPARWTPPDSRRTRHSGRQSHPTTPTNPGGATSQARGRRRAQRAPGWSPGGAQPRAKGDRGSGGCPPGKIPRAIAKPTEKSASKGRRRVATGANHPASHSSAFRRGPGTPAGAPTGDQSTAMHVTPKPPLARQDWDYRLSRSALFFLRPATDCLHSGDAVYGGGRSSRIPGG